jgi:Lamin Tail Domain
VRRQYNHASHHLTFNTRHVQVNPTSTDDATEWIEVYNATPDPVNMTGWTILLLNSAFSHTMTSFIIGSGEYKVLGRQSNITGVTVNYVYGSAVSVSPRLNNNGDVIAISAFNQAQDNIDFRSFTNSPSTFPSNSASADAGKSMQLRSLTMDNALGTSWCQSTTAWPNADVGDMGTPGKANDCPS